MSMFHCRQRADTVGFLTLSELAARTPDDGRPDGTRGPKREFGATPAQVKTLEAIARLGESATLTTTARAMGVSRPTIGKRISALRAKGLLRDGRRLTPTRAGLSLLAEKGRKR